MLKKGDVIFTADDEEKNISSLSKGFDGVSYYHSSLYIGENQLIEAIPNAGVVVSDLSKYQSKKNLVARIDKSDDFFIKVIAEAKKTLGAKYNKLFMPDTDMYYCSELIHKIFQRANQNIAIFKQHKLNYIKSNQTQVDSYWTNLYAKHGLQVPQDKEGSHPNNLSLDEAFTIKFYLDS